MCIYYTIHNGYLRDPFNKRHIIPFENIERVWRCDGSYCWFKAKDKTIGKISYSIGVAFKKFDFPDFVRYHEDGFVNFHVIVEVWENLTNRRTRKFKLSDDTPLETSIGKTHSFDLAYDQFLLREKLKKEFAPKTIN